MLPRLKDEPARGTDRIENGAIVLDGKGIFPKIVLITEGGRTRKYLLIKTERGGFLLNKTV